MNSSSIHNLYSVIIMAIGLQIFVSGCQPSNPPTINTNTSNFCYHFVNQTHTYDTIVGGTEINTLNSEDIYVVDLGFNFEFCGETFNKLYIGWNYATSFSYANSNGYLDFTEYELVWSGTMDVDGAWGTLSNGNSGNLSHLYSETTGVAGDRITTIEWRDFQYEEMMGDRYIFNFQIKLHENGNIVQYLYGPNDITTNFANETFEQFGVGLYAEDGNDGLFLSGDPFSPNTHATVGFNELNTWPAEGTAFTFH